MSDNYSMSYLHMRAGKYVVKFLTPYMEKYNLKVDPNRSSYGEISFIGEDGGYAGKVELDKETAKYLLYLNDPGTVILSGVVKHNHVSGVVEKMNNVNRGMMDSFTTFTTDYFEDHIEGVKKHYEDNVSDFTGRTRISGTWRWNDVYNLLMTTGKELTPNFEKRFENILPEDFMNELLAEYESLCTRNPQTVFQKA